VDTVIAHGTLTLATTLDRGQWSWSYCTVSIPTLQCPLKLVQELGMVA